MSKLRELRRARRLSIGALATLAGVSPAWLSLCDKHGLTPGVETQRRIAAALGVEPSALWSEGKAVHG